MELSDENQWNGTFQTNQGGMELKWNFQMRTNEMEFSKQIKGEMELLDENQWNDSKQIRKEMELLSDRN